MKRKDHDRTEIIKKCLAVKGRPNRSLIASKQLSSLQLPTIGMRKRKYVNIKANGIIDL